MLTIVSTVVTISTIAAMAMIASVAAISTITTVPSISSAITIVEPPYFVSKLKKTIQMVVEHPNPYKSIFSGSSKPLVFSLNDCSQWVCKSSLTG
ncbi:hypothetical protein TCAL_16875 [Tigriopus californicus]|uniref:Uncharacterized protein n=1 Tax=Tigriopus californicus TaxID=6832 RepID=A0A553PBX0_TIGCA|nr:hypothetical protein TCAL_16875 [Tigriopus californicus]